MSNAKKSCCEWFLSIFRKSPDDGSGNDRRSPEPPRENSSSPHGNVVAVNNNVNVNNYINRLSLEPIQSKDQYINLPTINTKFKEEDILSHIIPDKYRQIRYNCPICLKFFNHILVLSCCKNYLCLLCVNYYVDTNKKYSSKMKCPICNFSDKLVLEDVDPSQQVKQF
jgi:hypothetical protein